MKGNTLKREPRALRAGLNRRSHRGIVCAMNTRVFISIVAMAALAGCAGNKTQRNPSLVGGAPKAAVPERNYLKEAGDTTWQVVTAPARFVAPKKGEAKVPETY